MDWPLGFNSERSDLRFEAKEIWESIWLISRERSVTGFKLDFMVHGIMESLLEFLVFEKCTYLPTMVKIFVLLLKHEYI